MTRFQFWQRWLFVVSIAVAIFGLLMALFSGSSIFDLFDRRINPAFWGAATVDSTVQDFQQWVYGVWGATIAGWGTMLAYIALYPFGKKERWAWNCLVFGLLAWFVLDTSLSIFHGVYFNAAFNTILLILAGLPLIFTRREFA